MIHSQIDEETFIKNYISLFKPSRKSRQSLALFVFLVLAILCGCILIQQYLAVILIMIRSVKLMDEKWIRNTRHAKNIFQTNKTVHDGVDIDITEKGFIVCTDGCVYSLEWGSFTLFMESNEVIYLEHKFGGKYYIARKSLSIEHNKILHENLSTVKS
jgi:hypothetical protein